MAKPIKSLELHYPMIQFLTIIKKSYCYIYFVFSCRHFLVILKIIMVKKSK